MSKASWPVYLAGGWLLLALLLGGGLRFYQVGQVPPALSSDEAVYGVAALSLLTDGPALYYEDQGSGGVLTVYLTALAFWILEPGQWAMRFQASFIGWLTIPLLFAVVTVIFADKPPAWRYTLAGLSALLLSINHDHLHLSRIAFAAVHLPFLQLLSIYFFWRGLRDGRKRDMLGAGLTLGVMMYSYLPGAITPVLFALFAVLAGLFYRNRPHLGLFEQAWSLLGRRFGLLLVAFGLVSLPLAFFSLSTINNPDLGGVGRAEQTSFLNPNVNQGDPLGYLWQGIYGNYTAFGLRPLTWLFEGPPPSLASQMLLILVFGGLLLSLWRVRESPYLFLWLWWGLSIIPAALSPDYVPHNRRAVGVFPVMSLLAALSLTELLTLASVGFRQGWARFKAQGGPQWSKLAQNGLQLLLGLTLFGYGAVAVGQNSYNFSRYYFTVWPSEANTLFTFHHFAVALAEDMSRLAQPGTAFLLPLHTASSLNPSYTVNLYYDLTPAESPYLWLSDDEDSLAETLSTLPENITHINVIDWQSYKHTAADPKNVIGYYLEKHGAYSDTLRFEHYHIQRYRLEQAPPSFAADETLQPQNGTFGNQLDLVAAGYGPAATALNAASVPADGSLWARLRWQKTAPHAEDLKISLILQDDLGRNVASVDKHLQNNILHQFSSAWDVGTTADTYFLLNLPPYLTPGRYHLGVVAYTADSLTRLPAPGHAENIFPLGQIEIGAAQIPETTLPDGLDLRLVAGLRESPTQTLDLYAQFSAGQTLRPGQRLDIDLYWQNAAQSIPNLQGQVGLQLAGEFLPLTAIKPLGSTAHPSEAWRPGEVIHQPFLLQIPPGINGPAELVFKLHRGEVESSWPLGLLTIEDWPHTFELPADIEPLNARFGEQIFLRGYKLNTTSEQVNLSLFWQAEETVSAPYVLFVHLRDATGTIIAQVDRIPGNQTRPVASWVAGEVIQDDITFALPAETALDSLSLAVGLYHSQSFERVTVHTPPETDNQFIIPMVSQ